MSDARPETDEVDEIDEVAPPDEVAPARDAEATEAVVDAEPVLDGHAESESESDAAAAQVEIDLDLAVAAVEKERDDYLDALRRLQADFENYKKRMVRQQTELLERAGEGLVEKLLPVLDAIDLARQHNAGEGVEQIATALVDALSKEGLERVGEVGAAFDPNEHEAVAHQPSEEGDDGQVIAALMRAGYRWKGKLLRPAMVAVRG